MGGMQTNYPAFCDIQYVNTMMLNWVNRFYPLIPYEVLQDPDSATIDDVHDEVPEYHKVWADPVNLRAYVLPSEQAHPLTVFGIEELRDVVIFVAVASLIEAGLATQDATTKAVTLSVGVGDHFTYSNGLEYDVLEWRLDKTFANTDIPLSFQATAEKVRREATPYAGI